MTRLSPIQRFLGDTDLSRGPFGLLGLASRDAAEADIDRALEARLARIDQHPQHASAEANEVRLALHVAAAQLRDPAVRAALLMRFDASTTAQPVAVPVSAPPRPEPTTDPATERFRERVLQALIQSGGWNDEAASRAAALTQAEGRGPGDLIEALRAITSPSPADARAAGAAPAAPAAAPMHVRRIPRSPTRHWIITISTLVLLVATLAMGASTWRVVRDAIARRTSDAAPKGAASPPTGAVVASPGVVPRSADPLARIELADPQGLLGRLRASAESLRSDQAGALAAFREGIDVLAGAWPRVDPGSIDAMQSAVSDFIYQAGRRGGDPLDQSVAMIAGPAANIAQSGEMVPPLMLVRGVWSIGALTRLTRDRDLPPAAASAIADALEPHSVLADQIAGPADERPGFWSGVDLGLRSAAIRFAPTGPIDNPEEHEKFWRAWLLMAGAYRAQDASRGEDVVLDVIERQLVSGVDVRASRSSGDAMAMLVGSIKWSESPLAASRLHAWFADRRVSSGDIAAITEILVMLPAAPGLTSDLLLSASATGADRLAMRDRYAGFFPMPQAGESRKFSDRWAARAAELVAAATPEAAGDPEAALLEAVVISRVNEAASLLWRESDAASASLDEADAELIRARAELLTVHREAFDAGRLTSQGSGGDGEWARRFLRDEARREITLRLLNELGNTGGPVGPADADVLCLAALRHPNSGVRQAAQRIALRFRASPLVLNGILESLTEASTAADVGEFVADAADVSLPHRADPAWPALARAAVVASLLDAIAGNQGASVEVLAIMLEESYRTHIAAVRDDAPGQQRLLVMPVVAGSLSLEDTDLSREPLRIARPADAAAQLWSTWRGSAERYVEGAWTFTPLDELVRRREGRLRLVGNDVERLVAEQVSVLEVMAYVVAAERPTMAPAAERILLEAAAARRDSGTILDQVLQGERAQLRLWLIRLGMEDRL